MVEQTTLDVEVEVILHHLEDIVVPLEVTVPTVVSNMLVVLEVTGQVVT